MRRIILLVMGLVLGIGFGQSMINYCSSPPFVGGENVVVIPNVLITHDMTGSMRFYAYHYWNEPYNPNITYYGYADTSAMYDSVRALYQGGMRKFFQKNPNGPFSGNRINHAFMERIDVSRKAFTGGKGLAYDDKSKLIFEDHTSQNSLGFGTGQFWGIITTDSIEITEGIIRTIADQDNDFVWDQGAPNFALLTFSTHGDFGRKVKCPFDSSLVRMLTILENQDGNNRPSGSTNCGDAIFESIHYLKYCQPHWSGDYTWQQSWVGTPSDPWYDVVGEDTVSVSCRPTFCIVVGDGGSNSDVPTINCSHLGLSSNPSPYGPTHNAYWKYDYDEDYPDAPYLGIDPYDDSDSGNVPYPPPPVWDHTRPGDDYAYYGHINDLRLDADPIYGVPNKQSITFYTVYLFAQGDDDDADSILFRKIAKHGGFVDQDTFGDPGYQKYDTTAEYDADGNGRPDNFFYVSSGQELEEALTEILYNIEAISRVTSAAGGAITSPGISTGGFAYQAQFYPSLEVNSETTLAWLGNVQALWIDPYGFLREETQGDQYLHLQDDYVTIMYFDSVLSLTRAKLYEDVSGLGIESLFVLVDSTVEVESLKYVWDAADWLMNRDWDERQCGANASGAILANLVNFHPNVNLIDPFLGLRPGTPEQCDTLIKWTRGLEYPNRRCRTLHGDVWKLGDIIYSSPLPVAAPDEAYDLLYGDDSYWRFWNHYRYRPPIIYAGANDGFIHAFNAGQYEEITDPDPFKIGQVDPMGKDLGEELWAIVPHNLLPHLRWLYDTTYCHVYYNDLKAYATDVQIFGSPQQTGWHTGGWGTLLITGMRFGGGPISVGSNKFTSSYLVFDITDPLAPSQEQYPALRYEFSFPDLGYTVCMPNVVKVQNEWFIVFGTGPQTLFGESDQRARMYVANLGTGDTTKFILPLSDSNTVITNVFAVDWGLDYSVDLIYFGTYSNAGGGKIYRMMTHNNTNPRNWTLHPVIDLGLPITAEGSAAQDERGNLWVYFGAGKYFTNLDVTNQDTMFFVGFKDDTTRKPLPTEPPVFSYSDLVDVSDVEVYEDSVTVFGTFEALEDTIESMSGWYRSLINSPGERVVAPPVVVGGTVIFTTFVPRDTVNFTQNPDLCAAGGGPQYGYLWALYYLTGTAYTTPVLDTTQPYLTSVEVVGDMPSEPMIYIGQEQEKVFIQTAGGLISYITPLILNPRGGIILWRSR